MSEIHPYVAQVVFDTTDCRGLAEFYRQLLGYDYREGDEPPPAGEDDPNGRDWLVLRPLRGGRGIAFQQVRELQPSTWPEDTVPQQLHLDMTVPSVEELNRQHDIVLSLGGRLVYDRSHDPEEPLRVYADPAGHPFCVFVGEWEE